MSEALKGAVDNSQSMAQDVRDKDVRELQELQEVLEKKLEEDGFESEEESEALRKREGILKSRVKNSEEVIKSINTTLHFLSVRQLDFDTNEELDTPVAD